MTVERSIKVNTVVLSEDSWNLLIGQKPYVQSNNSEPTLEQYNKIRHHFSVQNGSMHKKLIGNERMELEIEIARKVRHLTQKEADPDKVFEGFWKKIKSNFQHENVKTPISKEKLNGLYGDLMYEYFTRHSLYELKYAVIAKENNAQIKYDSLVRPRKGAFKTQAGKFVAFTDQVKFGLIRGGSIISTKAKVLRSFAYKLTAKGVGMVHSYSTGPRPMCWSSGFKALHEKPLVTRDLSRLDSLRQKQICRLADSPIRYRSANSQGQSWNPIGYLHSYSAQFKDVGGRNLIEHPWQPKTWKERLGTLVYKTCRWVSNSTKKDAATQESSELNVSMSQIQVGEVWRDDHFRRSGRLLEVLKVGNRVKCRDLQTDRIITIRRRYLSSTRFTKLTNSSGKLM